MIISNYHTRPVLTWTDLSPREKSWFSDVDRCETGAYIRYHGDVYALYEFVRISAAAKIDSYWQGYLPVTAWDGLVVHIDDDSSVVVGYYYHTTKESE